jgi:hypothetical protein
MYTSDGGSIDGEVEMKKSDILVVMHKVWAI